jgi:hypothetical protein
MCKNVSVRYKNVKRDRWKLDKTGEQYFFGAKLRSETNDVTLHKDFFMENMAQFHQILKEKNSNFQNFMITSST